MYSPKARLIRATADARFEPLVISLPISES